MNNFLQYFAKFNYNYFFGIPEDSNATYLFLLFFLMLLVATIIVRIYFGKKAKTEPPYLPFAKKVYWLNFAIVLTGLFLGFTRYERANILSWRVWQILLILVFIAVNVWLFFFDLKKVGPKIEKYHDKVRKDKWLPKSKKKRK